MLREDLEACDLPTAGWSDCGGKLDAGNLKLETTRQLPSGNGGYQ